MAKFYTYYGNAIDMDRMVSMLARYKHGPYGFLTAAKSKRDMIRGTTENAVANLAEEIYNVGKSTQALPLWPRNGRKDPNAPLATNTMPGAPKILVTTRNNTIVDVTPED